MTVPARGATTPNVDDPDPPSLEEMRTVRERLATFDEDRKHARGADEVLERVLARHAPDVADFPQNEIDR